MLIGPDDGTVGRIGQRIPEIGDCARRHLNGAFDRCAPRGFNFDCAYPRDRLLNGAGLAGCVPKLNRASVDPLVGVATVEGLGSGAAIRSNQATDTELGATKPTHDNYGGIDKLTTRKRSKDWTTRRSTGLAVIASAIDGWARQPPRPTVMTGLGPSQSSFGQKLAALGFRRHRRGDGNELRPFDGVSRVLDPGPECSWHPSSAAHQLPGPLPRVGVVGAGLHTVDERCQVSRYRLQKSHAASR